MPQDSLILAPLAGYSNYYHRKLMFQNGADITYTEMISAEGIVRSQPRTLKYLKGVDIENHSVVQIFGSDPRSLARAADECIRYGANALDINMGCPVKKVMRLGAGVALMDNPQLTARIIRAVREQINVPLTVKIRSGTEKRKINYREIGRIAQEEGADAVILHPRTGSQKYAGKANWDHIADLVTQLNIPVIGNGDILTHLDCEKMTSETRCYAIMIGRGALGRPWLFKEIKHYRKYGEVMPPPTDLQRWEFIEAHVDYCIAMIGEKKGIRYFRKFLTQYLSGLPGVAEFRKKLFHIEDKKTLSHEVKSFLFGPSCFDALQ